MGEGYIVKSSFGHIRDLEKENFGIDIENGFKPNYKIIEGKVKVIKDLQAAAKSVDRVLLAADEDREGEAIALSNIGVLYDQQKDFKNGLAHYKRSLDIYKKIDLKN